MSKACESGSFAGLAIKRRILLLLASVIVDTIYRRSTIIACVIKTLIKKATNATNMTHVHAPTETHKKEQNTTTKNKQPAW